MKDRKVLLLGSTGKMGTALQRVLARGYAVFPRSSKDFDAMDLEAINGLVDRVAPDIVVNAVAFLGIDPCQADPYRAIRLNALLPRRLAEVAQRRKCLLIHFSTDAVFNDQKGAFYDEDDIPDPLNVYGQTKLLGDVLVGLTAERHYIFRIPILFGPTSRKGQFVEKMLDLAAGGRTTLRVADDIVSSPTYSLDAAGALLKVLEDGRPFGTYHLSNQGKASLFDLMREITAGLGLRVKIEPASYREFPFVGTKNTNTPITSVKLPPLRDWRQAVRDYCLEARER